MKKFLSLILMLTIVVSTLSVTALTLSAGEIGDNITWSIDQSSNLTISGSGEMIDFAAAEETPWYGQRATIKSVTVGNGISAIGAHAFEGFSKMTSANISSTVKSIGDYAFADCKMLYSFSIPSSVEAIGSHAFEKCQSIKELVLPDFVNSVGEYAFYNCTALRDLTLSSGIEVINEYTFANCTSIGNLTLFGTLKSVEPHAFEGCEGIRSVNIPSSVTKIGEYAFNNCKTLDNIKLPSELRSIGGFAFTNTAFYNDSGNWENGALYIGKVLICVSADDNGEAFVKEGTEYIAGAVTAGNTDIKYITVPASVSLIEKTAFEGSDITVKCYEGSYAAAFAKENSVDYEYIAILPEPTFIANGLQLKLANLEGVAVIRTAYGEYETEAAVKRGDGARAFSSKTVLKDKNEYTIQYRAEGKVTVSVRYEDGHTVFYSYNVTKKVPKVVKNENTVTVSGLDDLLVLRYVKGEYSASAEIKRAEGCINISGKELVSDSVTVTLEEEGIYTFCVQYKDESYNYYTITVDSEQPRIFCWGDSLTMGIETGWGDIVEVPYPERLEEYTGYETYNFGVGSDFSDQIAMRQGAIPVYVKNITIPASATPVALTPYLEDGTLAQGFCYNGFAGINEVEIAGVRGKLSDVNGETDNHDNIRVYFTRNEPGEEVVITEPTKIITNSALNMREDDILIIWAGSNDLNEAEDISYFEYIAEYQEAMIEFAGTDKFLIIGYTANNYLGIPEYSECADEYNALMKEYWGEHFVDIKEYMATYQALEDFGIEPTDDDKYRLAMGWIPLSFMERNRWGAGNAIHFNQIGYDCVEYLIELKLYELGYIE